MPRWLWIATPATAALLVAAWITVRLSGGPEAAEPGAPAPRFALLDHDGLPFGRERLEGHWSLLFFGYTECPDVCPITLQLVHQAREHLVRTSSGSPPRLIFVSLDSDRDTPASVKAYVQGFDASFLGVVGSSTEIARVEDWVAAAHWPGRGKGRIEHGAFLYVIDPQARASGRIEGIGDPVALAERIGALTSTSVARR